MTKSPRRVLVTGGAGFIGSHIVDDLVARGDEVHVLDDLSTGRADNVNPKATLHEVDLCDGPAVARLVEQVRPAVVSHQAAQASVPASLEAPARDATVNVVGGLHLLEACRRHRPLDAFLFASTGGAIYGNVPEPERAAVGRARRPASPYAIHKATFEDLLAVLGPAAARRVVVLRYANVYGARQRGDGEAGVVAIFLEALRSGRSPMLFGRRTEGDGGCLRDYVHVDDVVRAHREALDDPSCAAVINVGTGRATSTRDLLNEVARTIGATPRVQEAPPRPGDVERSVLEPGPGFAPRIDLAEGMRRLTAHA